MVADAYPANFGSLVLMVQSLQALRIPNLALASKMSTNHFLQDQHLDRMIHSQV